MKGNLYYLISSVALIPFSILFHSCVIVGDSVVDPKDEQVTSQERTTETIPLENQSRLVLEHTNGSIRVVGSDTTQNVHLEITKKVKSHDLEDATAHLRDISVTQGIDAEKVDITVKHPSSGLRNYAVDFEIVLPRIFDVEIQSGNSDVSLWSVSGRLILRLGNGGLELSDIETDRLDANIGNGDVDADVILADDCLVVLRLGNGEILLRIPRDTHAKVEATVGNGTVSSGGLNFESMESSQSHLKGVLGNGTGDITLTVGNGVIRLRGK